MTCRRCGSIVSIDCVPPSKPQSRCIHRGEAIGVADCGCCGNPRVSQCTVHGMCMIRKLKPGQVTVEISGERKRVEMAYCNRCADNPNGAMITARRGGG